MRCQAKTLRHNDNSSLGHKQEGEVTEAQRVEVHSGKVVRRGGPEEQYTGRNLEGKKGQSAGCLEAPHVPEALL